MRNAFSLLLLSLIINSSCQKNSGDPILPPVIPPVTPPVHVPINHKDIIGWWRTSETTYNWDGTIVFEAVIKYFGTDSFYYQVDGFAQGTTTGKWWWGENDSVHIQFNDGYQGVTGQNPFYPVTLPMLTKDSMYFEWQKAAWSYRYRHFDSLMINSAPISIIAGTGQAGSTGDEGPAKQAKFNYPYQVAIDKAGNIYIADGGNNRICKITTDGIIHTIAGKESAGIHPGDNIPAKESYLIGPSGLAVDDNGNIYLSSSDWNMISRITPDGMIHTIAGKSSPYGGFSGDGGPALNADLHSPMSLSVDDAGNLYFIDRVNARVRKIDPSGIIATVAGTGEKTYGGDGDLAIYAQISPSSMATDPQGNIYLADQNRIRKITAATGIIDKIAGDGTEVAGGENVPANTSPLKRPTSIQCDRDGNIYFTEATGRIRKISRDGILTTIAGCGIPGVFNYKRDGKHATAYSLASPTGIGVAPDGSIYFSDSFNQRIMRVGN